MPKIKPLGRQARYDEQTKRFEEIFFSRLGAKHMSHETLSGFLGKTRAATSYSLKNIDRMRFEEIRRMADALDLEIIIKRKGNYGDI